MNRSDIMRSVRSRDTKPELKVRGIIHALGYRYRLHRRDLPGTPDIAFPSRRKAIFVHGCWWHGHNCPRGARQPKSRLDYWLPKLARNKHRDLKTSRDLRRRGWSPMIVWECEIKDASKLERKIKKFLAT